MQYQAYSVHDKAVGAFMQPFYVRSKGEAVRSFMEACNDEKHQFFRNAGDYTLFHVGDFDDGSGMFIPKDPERVLSALEVANAGASDNVRSLRT